DVQLAMPQHPEERLFDDEVEIIELYAVDGNAFFQQGPCSVVVPTRKSQSKFSHGLDRSYSCSACRALCSSCCLSRRIASAFFRALARCASRLVSELTAHSDISRFRSFC